MTPQRIWIDTDPALGVQIDGRPRDIDDAYVLVEALNDPRVELAGVSVVFGNAPVDDGVRVAREVLAARSSAQPVHRGAAEAGDPARGHATTDAVRAMAAALREGPLTLLAIGPLTNIASLVANFPEEARAVERCIVVAGRSEGQHFEIGGARGVPDFNFESDWRAAQRMLESGMRVAMAGFELTHRVAVTRDDLESIRERNALTCLLVERSLPWLDFWLEAFPTEAGFHPWDSAALALILEPEFFVSEERGWRIRHIEPEASDGEPTPWLETSAAFPGPRVDYCPDFTPGGGASFIAAMLDRIR